MCTIGYSKTLNMIFKNRDKHVPTSEVVIFKDDILGIKTEGSNYYSLGINSKGCAFVSTAVNSPLWTSLAFRGKVEDAALQYKKENDGLINPIIDVSNYLPEVDNVEELLEKILNSGQEYMGYNLLLTDKEKAVHVELYRNKSHITWIDKTVAITNHFQHLNHGPQKKEDYPDSYERLEEMNKLIKDFISQEDIFMALKTNNKKGAFWRERGFYTVSSSVLDMDTSTIYYSTSQFNNYGRISHSIPPKGSERVFIEMSRYIDLPTYHKIERGHPFYEEMIEEVIAQSQKYYNDNNKTIERLKTLELGSGTGLCTLELVKQPFLELDCLEIDSECCNILASHPEAKKYNIINGDAVTYCKPHAYDLIISTFAHDHIHYNKRFVFAKNIYNNLKEGGRYIMGGEILPHFSNDMERKRALFKYHNSIIDIALRKNRVQLSELENNALKSGLDLVGDFKRHEIMFEEEMQSVGFKLIEKKKMGPLNLDDVGGVFVYIYEV